MIESNFSNSRKPWAHDVRSQATSRSIVRLIIRVAIARF